MRSVLEWVQHPNGNMGWLRWYIDPRGYIDRVERVSVLSIPPPSWHHREMGFTPEILRQLYG